MYNPFKKTKENQEVMETPEVNRNQNQSQNPNESQSAESLGFSATSTENAPKKRGRKPGSVNQNRQAETTKKIRYTLETMFGTASTLMIASGGRDSEGNYRPLAKDGIVIAQGSPALIDSIIALCEVDKNVREFFLSLSTGSAYANVAIASLPIVIGIMANHNLIPPIFGTPSPLTAATNGANG